MLSHSQGAVLTHSTSRKITTAAVSKAASIDSSRLRRWENKPPRVCGAGATDCGARRCFTSRFATTTTSAITSGTKIPKLRNQNEKNGMERSPFCCVQPRCHCKMDPACILAVVSHTKITAGTTAAATSLKSGDLEEGRVKNRTKSTILKAIKVWT